MLKKLFIGIILLALIGGGYYYWTTLDSTEETETVNQPGLVKISEPSAVSPAASLTNASLLYGLSTGRLMKYSIDSQSSTEYPVPEIITKSFDKLYWPRSGNDFIVSAKFEGESGFYYYDSNLNQYFMLPKNMTTIDWLGNSKQIVYVWKTEGGEALLSTSNADATGYQIIKTIPWSDVIVKASPTNNTVLLYKESSGEPVSKIYLYDLDTGDYIESVPEGSNTGAVWAPNGAGFAYTKYQDASNKVMYHSLGTGLNTDTGLVAGIDKVAFSQDGEYLYVAAMAEDGVTENIWQYSLLGKYQNVVFSSDKIRVKNIVSIGKKLFFLSQDNSLYGFQ